MIAIYARVSTEEQALHGASLAAQVAACRDFIGSTTEPIQEFIDAGESGADLDRPQLAALRHAIQAGRVQRVVILDPDRLSRKLVHQLLLTEEIERAGVTLEFVNFTWQDTPEGRLFYSLRGAIAEFEREKIRERARRGWIAKAQQGQLVAGMQRYGYSYDPVTKTLAENPETAAVVRMIFRWAAEEHLSSGHIARRLADERIPPPRGRVWWRDTVSKILRNPAYVGVAHVHRYDSARGYRERAEDEWIPIEVPPLVDQATWLAARDVIHRYRKVWKGRQELPMLLRRLAVCGQCGGPLSTNVRTAGGKPYRYYFCPRRYPRRYGDNSPRCEQPWIAADPVDEAVWGVVAKWLDDPAGWDAAVAQQSVPSGPEMEPGRVSRELARIHRARQRILALIGQDLVTEHDAARELAALKAEEAEWTARQTAQTRPPDWVTMAATLRQQLGPHLEAIPFDVRRDVVLRVVEHVTLGMDAEGGVTVSVVFRSGTAIDETSDS